MLQVSFLICFQLKISIVEICVVCVVVMQIWRGITQSVTKQFIRGVNVYMLNGPNLKFTPLKILQRQIRWLLSILKLN